MTRGCALALVVASMGCRGERTGVVAGPPLTKEPPGLNDASATPAPSGSSASSVASVPATTARSPIEARFVDLAGGPQPSHESLQIAPCEQLYVAVARGAAVAAGETLGPGDVLFARGAGPVDLRGEGLALVATSHSESCASAAPFTKTVVRASAAPQATFAGGKMRARFDVEPPASSLAYFGQLEGTAPVPEHAHEAAWEVLCAVEGAGTFTMNGAPHRLGPKEIVMIPPATRHSWLPDAGSSLVAFQMYSPPGPEQRFKAASAGARDAGPPSAK